MTEEEAVVEFREASSVLRRAYGMRNDFRVAQILADLKMAEATVILTDAQARLDAADKALQCVRAAVAPVEPEVEPVAPPVAPTAEVEPWASVKITQA